ncbi:sirohydrochlorin cobaltochelatase [Carboxylicivirga sp. N1Y90]|uniref:sirohydrochlorin cobaltochelatase n=1 Tax=Carboxylicivirga fragile TaxID=3417571 RepID=UPI003D34D230|nr:sirohydrochlorin cobaltochelatase [Marinilabiliaceae bacterium N1Y90]
MNLFKQALLFISISSLFCTSCSFSEKEKKQVQTKEAIVLATFGSSYENPQATFKTINKCAHEHFPNQEIRWAYTSNFIIKKLREGRGQGSLNGKEIRIYTPAETLEQLIKEGYRKIYVQSLHIIPGEEYDELLEATKLVENRYQDVDIVIGTPLLTSEKDIKEVAHVLANKFSEEIKQGPVLFMGHGTPHEADAKYTKLHDELQKINSDFYVGTVEGIGFEDGSLAIGSIISRLDQCTTKATTLCITPLMSVAGDHACNDLNADTGETDPAEQSWREQLEAKGYTVNANMNGLGDYSEINAIWMSHLEEVRK